MKKRKVKKQYNTISWLNLGSFPGSVCFCHGFDYDEIMRILKKKDAPYWYEALVHDKELLSKGNYYGLYRCVENVKTGESVNLYYIILKKRFRFTDWDYVMLAHEVLHICQFYLPAVLDRDREIEAEAYLHSHLMTQCLDIIRKN